MNTIAQDLNTMAAFLQNIAADHYRAKSQSADENGRIERGRAIVLRGGVRRDGMDWFVSSDTGTVEEYHVEQGACPCRWNVFHVGHCKHRFAIGIYLNAERQQQEILKKARYATYYDISGIAWPASETAVAFLYLEGDDAGKCIVIPEDMLDESLHVRGKVAEQTDTMAYELLMA